MKKVNIIYFCWCNKKKNYKNIIFGQLDEIISCGIVSVSILYLEVCCEDVNLIPGMKLLFDEKLKEYEYKLNFHTENKYEYYGIKKLYDLSFLEPDKYFIYLHSKGMFNYKNIDERHVYEKSLTRGTLYNYEEIIKLFDTDSTIVKATLFPADMHKKNFCWFNFFWIRGSYLNTCENPIITDYRFYYETWCETGDNSMGSVYNMYENNYKKYKLNEAGSILNNLNGRFFYKKN